MQNEDLSTEVVAMATIEANLCQLDLKVDGGEDASAKEPTSTDESAMYWR